MSTPASLPAALPALPGSSTDPGCGPVEAAVLDGLLDDAAPLAAHRDLLAGDHRDLVGALLVPAETVGALLDALAPGDLGLRVVLVAGDPDPLGRLRAARAALLDVDAVELVGARLPAPADAAALLDGLDSSVPSWITIPPGDDAAGMLDVLAADGAEDATLDVGSAPPAQLAGLLRELVDRDLAFRVAGCPGILAPGPAAAGAPEPGSPGTGGPDAAGSPDAAGGTAPGLLNVLCATRAALNGAEPAELAEILATRHPGPLVSALRRMSAADGAVTRAFLVAGEVPDAAAAAAELGRLGLLAD